MKSSTLHLLRSTALTVALLLLGVMSARAQSQVAVFSGYNDEPRNNVTPFSSGSGQPDPWYGSPNTTYFGNSVWAQGYDPDIDAILLINEGTSAISLSAASIGSYNLFTLDGITGSVSLAPGADVILAGVDGSDTFSGPQTIGLTLGGLGYAYTDVTTSQAPGGVLDGANPWIGGSESMPWTADYTPPTRTSTVPDAAPTAVLLVVAMGALAAARRRISQA